MKNMKRLLTLALALLMVLSIAACGGKNGNNGNSGGNGGQGDTPSDNAGGDVTPTGDGVGRYTYIHTGTNPKTWSPTDWEMTEEGDYWGYCVTPLWEYMLNDAKDGYDIVPSGATEMPIDLTATFADKAKYGVPEDATEGYVWQIKLNDQVAWEDGQKITADDYIYTLQQFLNPQMKNYRASQWYTGSSAIVNAQAYYNSDKAGETGFLTTLGDAGFATVAEAQEAGYTEFGIDLAGFWGLNEAGIVSITDETEYRDSSVDEGQPEDYISGKYVYDTYFAPGGSYEGYSADYLYVGETIEAVTWEDVGVIKDDDYTFTVVLVYPQTPFFAVYGLGSLCCVREDLYEANKQQAGNIIKSSYGTSPEKFMSYGPFKVASFQPDKEICFTRNDSWWGYNSDIYEGLYQTTDITALFIDDTATRMNLFLQGNLSYMGLNSENMKTYGNSDYVYFTPGDYTWKWSYTTDLEKLKEEEVPGENHSILHYKDFREAMFWAIDRQDYVAACTGAGIPAFGLFGENYVCNPDTGETYRSCEYAQDALCRLYGASSVDQITGYDPEKASALLQSAYDQCLADGNISETDKVVLDYHQYGSDDFYVRDTNYLQAALEKIAVGTSLEGRISVKLVEDPNYYENMRNGLCDIAYTGWGGSNMDPYSMMQCYCEESMLNETYGIDPYTETATIELDGQEITKTLNKWWEALCMGEYSNADYDTRNKIMAEMEYALLSTFFVTPMYDENSAGLYQQRIILGCEEYINPLIGRGGLKAYTYTMDDAEWAAYCASQNNQLTY